MKKSRSSSFLVIIIALSLAQFIMTVDTTIMNVTVPTLVKDLNTTVSAVQLAITLYALIMASFMLIGGKLGELYGRKRMFQVGLTIYAIGSLITSIAPNIVVLIIGWSILEGLGASMMMPAMMALISINFKGKQRVSALGITAGVAGAAAALGPIIGGALSTYASWRYAFVGEVIIAAITMVLSRNILDAKLAKKVPLDVKGAVLAASGLGIFVIGILQATTYGWIRATQPFTIGNFSFNLFGLSIVPFICGIGLFLIWRFMKVEAHLEKKMKSGLLKVSLLQTISLRTGLSIVLVTQLLMGGILFILPLFLQIVLGFSAIKSGVALLPLSIGLIGASVYSAKLLKKYPPTRIIRAGQYILLAGIGWLYVIISNDTQTLSLVIPFLLAGIGIGLIIPINQSVILGSASDKDASQVGGLNYTAQQLGMSLGTAVIGSVLIFSLGNGIIKGLSDSSQFDQQQVQAQSTQISSNVEFISNSQLQTGLQKTELSPDQQTEVTKINEDSRLRAIKLSIAAAFVIGLLSLVSSSRMTEDYKLKHKYST